MKTIRHLAVPYAAIALSSCAVEKEGQYDTANPYGTADAGAVNPPVTAPANPVYDTPPAYEESSATAAVPAAGDPGAPADPAAAVPPVTQAQAAPAVPAAAANANGAAIIHTVVKGDTLSGIATKYKVPAASIKTANRMTNDIVVLGRKMVIPPQ